MPIIVSQNGRNATKLDKISFGLENKLQAYIYDNPESIPLYDIKDDIRLLILAREFGTTSGPIDAVGIDGDGQLYLVETKLYKNPDKRTVVAQVLDYGASLWKSLNDFDDFLLQLNGHVQKKFGMSATEKIKNFFSISDDQLQIVLEQMKLNLDEGNFKFVVLMDSIEDRLKDLIVYMNQNSKFDIYGVELEYYQHDSFEILIPKIYGSQVKKDVGSKRVNSTVISDEEFLQAFDQQVQPIVQSIMRLSADISAGGISIQGLSSRKTPKNINFYFSYGEQEKNALNAAFGVNGGIASKTMDFWCHDPERFEQIVSTIHSVLGIETRPLPVGIGYGIVAKWDLKEVSVDKLIQVFEKLSQFSQFPS
jgi:hypothetical protein